MPTNKLTAAQKKIVLAHIKAFETDVWDFPPCKNVEDVKNALTEGKTSKILWDEISIRYCSITSILIGNRFGHLSQGYLKDLRRGFKIYLDKIGIQ